MVVMDIVFRVLLCTFTVLNLFAALILPVPGYAGRCCQDGEKGERGDPGHTGQKDNKGEKENDRDGRPGTRRPQRADSISLSLDSGIERIRSRGDSSDWEAESIKTMLSTMFETCIDGLLTGEEEEDSDLLRFTGVGVVKGEKGEKGDQGRSIMGEMGLPGEPGPIGPKGMKGERGEMGAMGSKGERGDRGEKGSQGSRGPMGNMGDPGPIGPAGPAGLPGPQGEKGQTGQRGLVYTRWGECNCPSAAVLLYDGIIVQAASMLTNLLCIPNYSTRSNQPCTSTTPPVSHITRLEPLVYTSRMGMTDAIPCAHCYVSAQSTVITFPGRTTCPRDWTRQYSGYLLTSYELSTTDVLCADEKLSREIQWRDNSTGATLRNGVNLLETVCGEGVASCRGHKAGQLMPCVVCSN